MSARAPGPGVLTTLAAVALSGALLLTGCSGGDSGGSGGSGADQASGAGATPQAEQTPAEETGPYAGMEPADILAKVQQTAGAARSVRWRANVEVDGEQLTLNIMMNRAGRASARITTEAEGSMRFVRIGRKGWILPGKDMLSGIVGGDAEVRRFMRGKWLEAHSGSPEMKENYELTDMDAVLEDFVSSSTGAHGITQVEGKKFGRRETIGLRDAGTLGTMYVAADGSGELVAFEDGEGVARFTDWNKKVEVRKPADILTDKELDA